MPDPNPKQAFGDKKPSLAMMPLTAKVEASYAFMDGAFKYGRHNWRKNAVEAQTYVEAIHRHVDLWAAGQERTSDTDVHNLGAIIACCSILIDAMAHNGLIDNRSKSDEAIAMLERGSDMVEKLKAAQAAREAAKADLPIKADDRARLVEKLLFPGEAPYLVPAPTIDDTGIGAPRFNDPRPPLQPTQRDTVVIPDPTYVPLLDKNGRYAKTSPTREGAWGKELPNYD